MKMIEVRYRDLNGSEWKTAKTKSLKKLLERVFGKNSCFDMGYLDTGYPYVKFMFRHLDNHGYYNVLAYDDYYLQFDIVGQIYISSFKSQGIDIDDKPHKFFEGATYSEVYDKMREMTIMKQMKMKNND
jgi:hypothetical protein